MAVKPRAVQRLPAKTTGKISAVVGSGVMSGADLPDHLAHRSADEFVDQLFGDDVDLPEMKEALKLMMAPTLDVIWGKKTGIDFIVEDSEVDEGSVIKVLMALSSMPLPVAVARHLADKGFDYDGIRKVDIGIKRVAMALVNQHCGLLADAEQSEPGEAS